MKNAIKKDKLLIVGASGHGKVVADIAMHLNQWQEIAFLDDDETITKCMGYSVIDKTDSAAQYISDYEIIVAIGKNVTRQKIQTQLEEEGACIATLVHPGAIIGNDVEIESGSVVMAGSVINCCSKIGKGCIINTGAAIDHDNEIGDFVHISPGVHSAGTVKIGDKSWIGIGAVISNNLNITKEVIIGAGAVVMNDIENPGIYVGVPAKMIENLKG